MPYLIFLIIAFLIIGLSSFLGFQKKEMGIYASNKNTGEVMLAIDKKNEEGLTFIEKMSCHGKYSHKASNNSNEEIYATCLREITDTMMLTKAEAKLKDGLNLTEAYECNKQNKTDTQCLNDIVKKLKEEE